MTKLTKFTIKGIRSWHPCYDPNHYLSEDWKGTVIDILKHKEIPPRDKLWCVCREGLLSASLLRHFAVAQAKTCLKQVRNKKEFNRILKVCLRFADNKATTEELSAVWSAAESAARSAAESAAWSAAESAARSAARSAAWFAAESAVRSAAESAAWSTVWSAAWSAAESAAWSAAESAARSAARSAAESAACKLLIKLIRKEINNGSTKD